MVLKHRDRELLRFEWIQPRGVRVLSVNEAEKKFLPLEMRGEATDKSLWEWLVRRTVPKYRKNIEMLLAAIGLSGDNIQGIIGLCHGLSLNDVYWVVQDTYRGLWKDNNLYTNKFSNTIAKIAFSGELPHGREEWTSSPELTTNGMLAKCWRRLEAIEDWTQKRVAEILEFGVKADRYVAISKKVCTINPTNCESLALQIKANLKADPYITKDELAEILGVSVRSIAYKLKQLKDSGAIERCGSTKKGYWMVIK